MQPIANYRLSVKTGAVLEKPVCELPLYYEVWNELTSKLGQYDQLCDHIKTMPILQPDFPMTYEELRFAHKVLAFAASVYVWMNGENNAPKVLPAQLAVPLMSVSLQLGLPPILTHQDLVLGNCIQSERKDIPDLINQPTQHKSWKPFIELSGLVELQFAPAIQHICDAIAAQDPLNESTITLCLSQIRQTIDQLCDSLKLFHARLDANEFYVHLRPILCGWSRHPIENGLIFEQVTSDMFKSEHNSRYSRAIHIHALVDEPWVGLCIRCIGASAAQSICLQALDAFLQIVYEPEIKEFFETMRCYMIPEHHQFLVDLQKHSRIREIALNTHSKELKGSYNDCIRAIHQFRKQHMILVSRFIEKPAAYLSAKMKSLETTGTGGQKLQKFLSSVQNSATFIG